MVTDACGRTRAGTAPAPPRAGVAARRASITSFMYLASSKISYSLITLRWSSEFITWRRARVPMEAPVYHGAHERGAEVGLGRS